MRASILLRSPPDGATGMHGKRVMGLVFERLGLAEGSEVALRRRRGDDDVGMGSGKGAAGAGSDRGASSDGQQNPRGAFRVLAPGEAIREKWGVERKVSRKLKEEYTFPTVWWKGRPMVLELTVLDGVSPEVEAALRAEAAGAAKAVRRVPVTAELDTTPSLTDPASDTDRDSGVHGEWQHRNGPGAQAGACPPVGDGVPPGGAAGRGVLGSKRLWEEPVAAGPGSGGPASAAAAQAEGREGRREGLRQFAAAYPSTGAEAGAAEVGGGGARGPYGGGHGAMDSSLTPQGAAQDAAEGTQPPAAAAAVLGTRMRLPEEQQCPGSMEWTASGPGSLTHPLPQPDAAAAALPSSAVRGAGGGVAAEWQERALGNQRRSPGQPGNGQKPQPPVPLPAVPPLAMACPQPHQQAPGAGVPPPPLQLPRGGAAGESAGQGTAGGRQSHAVAHAASRGAAGVTDSDSDADSPPPDGGEAAAVGLIGLEARDAAANAEVGDDADAHGDGGSDGSEDPEPGLLRHLLEHDRMLSRRLGAAARRLDAARAELAERNDEVAGARAEAAQAVAEREHAQREAVAAARQARTEAEGRAAELEALRGELDRSRVENELLRGQAAAARAAQERAEQRLLEGVRRRQERERVWEEVRAQLQWGRDRTPGLEEVEDDVEVDGEDGAY